MVKSCIKIKKDVLYYKNLACFNTLGVCMDRCCGFFGHRDFFCDDADLIKIKNEILSCINRGIYSFLICFYGNFDGACASIIYNLKKKYPQIKSYLVIPYRDKKFHTLEKEYIKETFDEIIYPPIENIPKKFAILKCNEWIVSQCDYLIFYVNFSFGGAYKTMEFAHRKKKKYINFGIKVI